MYNAEGRILVVLFRILAVRTGCTKMIELIFTILPSLLSQSIGFLNHSYILATLHYYTGETPLLSP